MAVRQTQTLTDLLMHPHFCSFALLSLHLFFFTALHCLLSSTHDVVPWTVELRALLLRLHLLY